jgi:membrane associated rhomboid family serine protease
MIPLRDENPSRSVPVVTRALIAVNAACFIYELSLGPELRPFVFTFGLVPLRVSRALEAGGGALLAPGSTLLTSMFLHAGWLHLIGNMWYLWIFGDNVEDRLGRVRFAAFYLASGLVAALLQFAVNPLARVPTVGASGAVAGVLGAYMVAFPRARVITLVPLLFFFPIVALPAMFVLGLWFVYQFFSGTLSIGTASGGVAWWAHIGGFAFGYLVMRLLGGATPRGSHAWVE